MNREQGIIAGIIATTTAVLAAVVVVYVNGGPDATQTSLEILGFASPTVAGLFAALKADQAATSATDAANTAADTTSALVEHTAAVTQQIAAVTKATPAVVGEVVQQALADKTVTATDSPPNEVSS